MPVPNNIILRKHRIAAFCITKVANTSIKVAFCEALGLPTSNPHSSPQRLRPDLIRCASKEEISCLKADWFTFAFIRNPWDRMVSLWANKGRDQIHSTFAKRGMGPYPDFNDFVKALCERTDFDIHWVSQAESILIDGQEVPGFIGRYENLKDDWQFIQKKCLEHNLKLPDLERRNSSAHDHYRKYYSPESRDLIAGKYAQDIEAFGYEY